MFPSSVLTKKIAFITKETTLDEYNVPEEDVETHKFYVWANMFVRSANRDKDTYSYNIREIVEWKLRYRSDITSDMSIKYCDKYYKIDSVVELGEKNGLLIETKVTKFGDL